MMVQIKMREFTNDETIFDEMNVYLYMKITLKNNDDDREWKTHQSMFYTPIDQYNQ